MLPRALDLPTLWKLVGVGLALIGAGAAATAARVSEEIEQHDKKTDSIVVELRKHTRLLQQQICLTIREETTAACLQK